jgi:hypothetical protein
MQIASHLRERTKVLFAESLRSRHEDFADLEVIEITLSHFTRPFP